MRIGFDARMIDHPGIGRYIINLLNAMLQLRTEHELILFGNRNKHIPYTPHLIPQQLVHWDAPVYSIQEQLNNPFASYNLDILHCPHFNIPYFYHGKLIVTIHDLIYLIVPRSVPSKLAAVYANLMISRSITKATKIIAVSENTKKDIARFFKRANSNKIEVIYEAADPTFKKITNDKLVYIKKKHNLPDKFILFVGSLKYHKNLKGAIKAFLDLKTKIPDCNLVIVGRFHKREGYIEKMIKSSGAFYLGEVSSEELTGIYNLASVLLHPSLYEGFGLTILEAMACGTPVVCSKSASLSEIGADAALQVDANDIAEISDALYNVLTDETLRNDLINKGFDRVKNFSWHKTAEKTLKLYEGII